MNDMDQGVSPQPAGQPEPSPQTPSGVVEAPLTRGVEPAKETSPIASPVTLDTVRAAIREELEQFQRKEQSARDRVTARLQKQIDLMSGLQIDVTPEMKTKLQTRIEAEVSQEDQVPPSSAAPAAQVSAAAEGAPEGESNPIFAAANEIVQEAGVTLTVEDIQALRDFKGTPRQWLREVEKVAAARKAAQPVSAPDGAPAGNPPEQASTETIESPQATTPLVGGGGSPGSRWAGKNSLDILTEGYRASGK